MSLETVRDGQMRKPNLSVVSIPTPPEDTRCLLEEERRPVTPTLPLWNPFGGVHGQGQTGTLQCLRRPYEPWSTEREVVTPVRPISLSTPFSRLIHDSVYRGSGHEQ